MTVDCSSSLIFQIGNKITTVGTFTIVESGAPVDPTQVFVKVKSPDGTEVEKEYNVDLDVIKSSTGVYYYSFLLDQAGYWYVRWYSTGNVVTSTEKSLLVRDTQT